MIDTVVPRAKAPSDLQMLAQVEQWMTVIREIDREERPDVQSASKRLERLLTPIAE